MSEISSARSWPLLAAGIAWEDRLGRRARARGRLAVFGYEFLRFGVKQGWACLFGGMLLALLIASHLFWPRHAPLARYDALVIGCVLIQIGMVRFRLESLEELGLIALFHVVGTVMEVFKTATGSWNYPEPSILRLGGVPLFSGFMYGAVGSYLARVWRLFDLRFDHHPGRPALMILSVAIYANFFSDHWGIDLRIPLILATVVLFRRTVIYFRVWRAYRHMPLLLGFFLVALFIWFAENIGTLTGTWLYPAQMHGWHFVSPTKLVSWFLLMLISYTMVAVEIRPRNVLVIRDSAAVYRARP